MVYRTNICDTSEVNLNPVRFYGRVEFQKSAPLVSTTKAVESSQRASFFAAVSFSCLAYSEHKPSHKMAFSTVCRVNSVETHR